MCGRSGRKGALGGVLSVVWQCGVSCWQCGVSCLVFRRELGEGCSDGGWKFGGWLKASHVESETLFLAVQTRKLRLRTLGSNTELTTSKKKKSCKTWSGGHGSSWWWISRCGVLVVGLRRYWILPVWHRSVQWYWRCQIGEVRKCALTGFCIGFLVRTVLLLLRRRWTSNELEPDSAVGVSVMW